MARQQRIRVALHDAIAVDLDSNDHILDVLYTLTSTRQIDPQRAVTCVSYLSELASPLAWESRLAVSGHVGKVRQRGKLTVYWV
jgi:hypothetical protein